MGVSTSLLACQSDTGTKELQHGHGKDMRRGLFPCWAAEPSAAPWAGVVGSTRVSKAPGTGAAEQGLLGQGHNSAPTLTLKAIVGMENSGLGPSILPHLHSPGEHNATKSWGSLLAPPDPPSGNSTKPWSRAQGQSSQVPHSAWLGHGLSCQVLTGMCDSGRTRTQPLGCRCVTLEGHSHWDAALNTPRSGLKVPWDAPACGEAWED